MSDEGSAMTAAEVVQGLSRLGVLHKPTLPYSPNVNGKIENLWSQVEGRLMAMLEDVQDLTLEFLNEATQAWVEFEYNRKVHEETGEAPIVRFLAGPSVLRPSPDSAALRLAFTKTERRTQRKSDGTIVIAGQRFEIPNRYRHFTQVEVRYASWDLTQVHLVDDRSGQVLCRLFPQDKAANASGLRRALEPIAPELTVPPATGTPPLLAKLLNQQAESGLPPAYLPKDDDGKHDDGDDG
jgi:putative transposase